MDLEKIVAERKSVRVFSEKKVEEKKVLEILQKASLAPSAGNLQAYDVFVVSDGEKKQALAEAAFQKFVSDAPFVLVFCSNKNKSASKYGERGERLYSVLDATIYASYVDLLAQNAGLGTCWVGAFETDRVAAILECPDGVEPIVIMPLGFAARSEKTAKKRQGLEAFLHKDIF